ncbi:MAG: hypothetical protein FWH04_05835 [Oscillospiraceae bacterium]|nr:hypothetical protein [Oscillospiraceae bacterium]
MKRIKKVIALITVLLVVSSNTTFAHEIKNAEMMLYDDKHYQAWAFLNSSVVYHAKSKKYNYRYVDARVKNKYASIFDSGIKIWGTYIDMKENNKSVNIVREVHIDKESILARSPINAIKKQHITQWIIEININSAFMKKAADVRARVLAHEIGHVYGLGHVQYSVGGRLMSNEENAKLSNAERLGMTVVTGVHKHDKKRLSKGYNPYIGTHPNRKTMHKRICSCGMVLIEKHKYKKNTKAIQHENILKKPVVHNLLCVDCGDRAKDKKHSYGGEFPDGKTVRYSRINSTEHNEIRKCKGCDYTHSVRNAHSTGGKFSDGKKVRYTQATASEHNEIKKCKECAAETSVRKKHSFTGKFSDGKKVRYTQATASEHNEIKKCKECGAETSVRKKHSTGGKFSDGKKVRYTRANANEHNEIKKCKGCNYEQSVRKKHRFDKKGKCKDCGFVK